MGLIRANQLQWDVRVQHYLQRVEVGNASRMFIHLFANPPIAREGGHSLNRISFRSVTRAHEM